MQKHRHQIIAIIATSIALTTLGACGAKPDDATLNQQAAEAIAAHKYNDAISLAQQAIKANPNNKDAHFTLARAYLESNQPQKAVDEAQTLLKSGLLKESQQLQNTFLLMGAAYVDMKNLSEAAKAFDNASETQPPNPAAYAALGEVLYRDRQFKDAIPAFDEAIKLDPKNKTAYHLRGMSYLATGGDMEHAFEDFERASALDPGDAEVANDYVTCAEFFEKYKLCMYILDLLHEFNPNADQKDTHDRIWKEAYAQAKKDHDAHPNQAVPYAYAAYLFMDQKDYSAARQSVDKIFKLPDGKDVPLAWRIKGDLAVVDGKYEEALQDYDTAIKVFTPPKSGWRDLGSQITHLHRDKVLKKLGRTS